MEKITFIEKIKNTEREVVLAPKIGSPILRRRETLNFCLRGERQLKFWEVGWIFCATYRYFILTVDSCGLFLFFIFFNLVELVHGTWQLHALLAQFWGRWATCWVDLSAFWESENVLSDFLLELGTPYVSTDNRNESRMEWKTK